MPLSQAHLLAAPGLSGGPARHPTGPASERTRDRGQNPAPEAAPDRGPGPDRAPLAPDLGVLDSFDRGRSAGEFAFEEIREAILSLALPPGAVLDRAAIAARLGVSQTPVREALIRLQEEGLVAVVPHSATRVAPIDPGRAREAHFLRLAVEVEVVRTLAAGGLASETAARLDGETEAMRRLLASPQEGFPEFDRRFHAGLSAAAGLPGLWHLVRGRSGHLDRLRRLHLPVPGKAEAIIRDHYAILAAILARDVEAAGQAMRTHLSGTFAEIEAIRGAHPRFF